jgi:hypothetical protein
MDSCCERGGRGICIFSSLLIASLGIATALVANHACSAKLLDFVKYKTNLLLILLGFLYTNLTAFSVKLAQLSQDGIIHVLPIVQAILIYKS